MPFYGQRQAAALFAKYSEPKAKRIIKQLKKHGTKKAKKKEKS